MNKEQILKDLNLWTKFKKELCNNCQATCCSMPVELDFSDLVKLNILDHFHLELSEKEQTKIALKSKYISRYTPSTKKFTLKQKPNGTCIFLNELFRCDVYEDRPKTCQNHLK